MDNRLANIQLIGKDRPLWQLLGDWLEQTRFVLSPHTSTPCLVQFGAFIVTIDNKEQLKKIQSLRDSSGCFAVLALIKSSAQVSPLQALRAGADDVFLLSQLAEEKRVFLKSLKRLLKRCKKVYTGQRYRESLEASLEELKTDQQAAYHIQTRLLPPAKQTLHDIQFAYSLTPSLIVSGDFVDIIPVDEALTFFYIADVSGHGASSGLMTVLLKNITARLLRNYRRASSYDILSPQKTLQRINAEVFSLALDKHLTAFCGLIDHRKQRLSYGVAGQHPMPVYKHANHVEFLPGRGMALGLFPDACFGEEEWQLDDDFSLTLLSDGVLELLDGSTIEEKKQTLMMWLTENQVEQAALSAFILPTDASTKLLPDDVTIMTLSRTKL